MARRKTRRNLASKSKISKKPEPEVLQLKLDKSSSELSSSESDDELGNLASEMSKKIKAKLKSGQKTSEYEGLEGGTLPEASLQFFIDKTPGGNSQSSAGEPGTSHIGDPSGSFNNSDSESESDDEPQYSADVNFRKLPSQSDPDNDR